MIAPRGQGLGAHRAQRALLADLIGEWVGLIGDDAAAVKMAEVKSGLDNTYFAWAGATTAGANAYFRIQGPAVFIEYATPGQSHYRRSHPHHLSGSDQRLRRAGDGAVTRIVAVTTALVLATSTGASAHRLDEYLQAAAWRSHPRISRSTSISLGVSVAAEIIALLDGNGDGRVSPLEAEAYGRAVLADVSARLDGGPLGLTLTRVEVPTEGEMRDGVGTIRIEAAGAPHAHDQDRTSSSCGTHIGRDSSVLSGQCVVDLRTPTSASCDSSATQAADIQFGIRSASVEGGGRGVAHYRRSGADGACALADTPAT